MAAPRKPRPSKAKSQCKLMCCTTPPEALERIKASLEEWEPGKWSEQNNYGPGCTCTLAAAKEPCQLHG